MAIRKLVDSFKDSVELTLGEKQGVMALDEGGQQRFFYFDHPSEEEVKKFKKLSDVNNIRFFGPATIYNLLLGADLKWPNFSKITFVKTGAKVHFFPQTNSLRVEKTESETKKIKKVLIVDDSATIQKMLQKVLAEDETSEVIGVASCPSEARAMIEKERPDVITLDIHMPEMNGVEFYESYISEKKIPTVLISSVSPSEGPLVLEGLSLGVFTYIKKPTLENFNDVKEQIKKQIQYAVEHGASASSEIKAKLTASQTLLRFNSFEGAIVIGSSTGGTQALEQIFCCLPHEIPPIVVVQHIPAVFSKALADRLNNLTAFTVKEAQDGDRIEKNTVYIAPGGQQLKLLKRSKDRIIKITDDAPVNRFKPSVDYLFNSVADYNCRDIVAVILTGMGKDGAKGLLRIKESDGLTIAQDEASSVVFGMPREAIALGAAQEVCSLDNMATQIAYHFNKLSHKEVA